MLLSLLKELIINGENSGVEFKRDDIRPEQLAREAVAMANLSGGKILLGVEDDGTLSGITRPDLQEWVLNVFRDKIHPWMIPFYEEVLMSDGKKVAVITFPQGISKPYVVRHNGREDAYIRMGNRSEPVSREQYIRLSSSGGLIHPETLPVSGSGLDALDRGRITDYLTHILGDTDDSSSERSITRKLINLGLLTQTQSEDICCTIAGVVLFGLKPRRWLQSSGIRLTVYSSEEKEYETLLDTNIDECFAGQWEVTGGTRQWVRGGIVDLLMFAVNPFISKEVLVNSLHREKSFAYPPEALREVVVNAIVHRDWTRWVDIEVSVYSNRLEVISPGGLQNYMTVEKMIEGQRSHRNPILVETARDYGYMEGRGMGIRRKVIPALLKSSGRPPDIVCTEDSVKFVLYPNSTWNGRKSR